MQKEFEKGENLEGRETSDILDNLQKQEMQS